MGKKTNGTSTPNPLPDSQMINFTHYKDNMLNLYYRNVGRGAGNGNRDFPDPSLYILDEGNRLVNLGRVQNRNKNITVKSHREIMKYAVGTHQIL